MNLASGGDTRNISDEIEQRRVLFEQTWGQPDALSLEHFLDGMPEVERPDLLRELLYIEFELTQRRDTELSLEQYLMRFPEHETIIREVADAVKQYTVFKRRNIDGYTLLGELGRGGMGTVYKAKNDLLNSFVAFKMINQRMVDQPETRRRFQRELETIGRLKHPNIVDAKHAGVAPDGSPYLVMELIEGITLSQWSRQNLPPKTCHPKNTGSVNVSSDPDLSGQKTLKVPESSRIAAACAMICEVARGLQAIHEAGLVHRDIKPSNIMLQPDGRVKILDLGLAKLREHIVGHPWEYENQTQQGHALGTPGFMAPEQVHSAAHVDIRADIYSLGCTLFFLLYGRGPAENRGNEFSTSLPKPLQAILDRMLATDPAARFQEPQEVVKALEALPGPPKKTFLGTTIATFLAFLGVVSIFFFSRTSEPPSPPQWPTLADVQVAVDLRYRGDDEQAANVLREFEETLRANPFDGSNAILAEVLAAQGDCIFFSGLASQTVPEKMVKRLVAWYDEALKLAKDSPEELRTKLLCKLAIVNGTEQLLFQMEKDASLYLRFAGAVMATDDQQLRNFIEQFELSAEPELMTREALDLRLFALERLIDRSVKTGCEKLPTVLRSLDAVLLPPSPVPDSSVYLNRFFDLAIRVCDPTDYGQLVKYLYRLRSHGATSTRSSFPPDTTLVLIYFSPWSDKNGFAVYYPAERRESQRFELPFNRSAVKDAIRRGESLRLNETLVSLVRQDVSSGVPILLSWDDTTCWPLRRDAFSTEDWPFDESFTVEEILGRMK